MPLLENLLVGFNLVSIIFGQISVWYDMNLIFCLITKLFVFGTSRSYMIVTYLKYFIIFYFNFSFLLFEFSKSKRIQRHGFNLKFTDLYNLQFC